MKLKNLVPRRYRTKVIRQFGDAKLIKLPNGEHELIGGSDADRTAAFEWVSLPPKFEAACHAIPSRWILRFGQSFIPANCLWAVQENGLHVTRIV